MKLRLFRDPSAKQRQALFSGGGLLALAAVVVLLNLLSQGFFVRWDWTAGDRYSLSPASKELVRTLPDPVVIRFFLTEGLPQPYQSQGQYIRDLLREYRVAAKGKVRVEIVNPEESDQARGEANGAGVVPARFTQVASDQFQVREGFMGLALFYQDKQAVIPFVKDTNSLEYDISSRLKRMAFPEKKTLGFVTGHGEVSPDSLRGGFAPALFERFDVQSFRLSTAAAATPDLIFIVGPRNAYSPEELAVLDGYLEAGVPLAVFLNRRVVNLGAFSTVAQVTKLEPYLEHYGVRMDRDFVLDAQCQRISMQSQQGPYAVTNILNYPAIPLADDLNGEHLLTKSLDVLSFPFAHPVHASTGAPAGLTTTILARSSPYSWISPGLSILDPYEMRPPAESDPKGPFPLALAVEGSAPSYSDPRKTVSNVRLLVVGTAFFSDPQMPLSEGNALFFINAAEWLSQDPILLSIPSKGAAFRPIRQLPPVFRMILKWLGYFLLPLAVGAGALIRWRRRQTNRRRVEAEFQLKPAAG
jgi:gliding-associated putative ABC transporter substrate-binding component GldG